MIEKWPIVTSVHWYSKCRWEGNRTVAHTYRNTCKRVNFNDIACRRLWRKVADATQHMLQPVLKQAMATKFGKVV